MKFIFPVLRDLRRITKLFQKKTADNLKIFEEIKLFFLDLANRILRKSTIDNNTVEQLCGIKLDDASICLLSLDDTKYGEIFNRDMMQFSQNTRKLLKTHAANFLRELFKGLQKRLRGTFKLVQDIEPFSLPRFKNNPPKVSDFKKPFFDTGKITSSMIFCLADVKHSFTSTKQFIFILFILEVLLISSHN